MAFLWRLLFSDFQAVFSKSSNPELKEPGSAALPKKSGSLLSVIVILDIPLAICKVPLLADQFVLLYSFFWLNIAFDLLLGVPCRLFIGLLGYFSMK